MNLNLLSPFIRSRAGLIHSIARQYESKSYQKHNPLLPLAINDIQQILCSVDKLNYKECDNNPIEWSVVKNELSILSTDAKKISHVISERAGWAKQCAFLDDLAKKLLISSKMYDDHKQELLLLLGATDQTSPLNILSPDIINIILNDCVDIELDRLLNYKSI